MTGIIYNKKINKIISLILITSLLVLEVFYRTVNADNMSNEFTDTFGKDYPTDEFWMWTMVDPSDNGNALYTALDSYKKGDRKVQEEYEKGTRTFRVLFTQELCGSLGSTESKIAGIESDDNWIEGFWNGFEYSGYTFVQADYSREVYNTDHRGESVYRPSKNPQIQVGALCFLTRGPQRAFIFSVDPNNNNGYKIYYPDEKDKDPFLTLTYAHTLSTGNELWLYDNKGVAWGRGDSKYTSANGEFTKSHMEKDKNCWCSDTWYVKKAGTQRDVWGDKDAWRGDSQKYYYEVYTDYETASSSSNAMYLLLSSNGFDCLYYNKYSDFVNFNDWMLYVGEPVEICDSLVGREVNANLSDSRTIDKPTYVKFDEEFTVNTDGVLFVEDLLILNGKLINRGIIVVEKDASIMQWDKSAGKIENYGDIILRDKSYIFVDEFKTENGQLILNDEIAANKLDIKNSVVDFKNKQAKLRNVEWVSSHWADFYKLNNGGYSLKNLTGNLPKFTGAKGDWKIDTESNIKITSN